MNTLYYSSDDTWIWLALEPLWIWLAEVPPLEQLAARNAGYILSEIQIEFFKRYQIYIQTDRLKK